MISEGQTNIRWYNTWYHDGRISEIENYDKAIADDLEIWHLHHRNEIKANGVCVSIEELKSKNLYYHRPPNELIFMTRKDHISLHMKGENNPNSGKHPSEETRRKMSEAQSKIPNNFLGHKHSEESRRKMSEARKRYLQRKKEGKIDI